MLCAMVVDYTTFKDYKEQPFKWKFWAHVIRKKTRAMDHILELGCTHGYIFSYLKEYKNKSGVDISHAAIEHAKKINPLANFSVMDAEKLAFEDEAFQLVLCIDMIEHVKNPEACIQEAYRILKKGGYVIITTPNPESYSRKKKGLKWFAFQDPTHISIYEIKKWTELLEKNNFVIENATTIDLFDMPYFSKWFQGINWFLYTIRHPFIPRYGDNSVFIARKR